MHLQPEQPFSDVRHLCTTQILLCTDHWKDAQTLHAAYYDDQGIMAEFMKNSLKHAVSSLQGSRDVDVSDWIYEVTVDADKRQVCKAELQYNTHIPHI